jgi:ubiquinone/menaquinone biosynthesis C-methylase UbiE
MPTSREFLLDSNRSQVVSEADTFTAERYRQMCGHLPPAAAEILDVGCNTGRGGAALKSLNPNLRITGLDCLQDRIGRLDPAVYERGICGFSTEVAVPNNSFDAIVAGEFIEHVPADEIDATLAEFFRILRLRGRLILTTPNPGYLKNKLRHLSVLLDSSHVTQHFPDCLRRRLRTIGYSGVKLYGSGRMIRYIGQRIAFLPLYGSYLIRADKW